MGFMGMMGVSTSPSGRGRPLRAGRGFLRDALLAALPAAPQANGVGSLFSASYLSGLQNGQLPKKDSRPLHSAVSLRTGRGEFDLFHEFDRVATRVTVARNGGDGADHVLVVQIRITV